MTKISPTTVAAGLNSAAVINANFQAIADELNDKVLYRDNTGNPGEPNTVEQDVDFNSFKIINLADGVADSDAATIRQAKTALGLTGIKSSENVTAVSDGQTVFTLLSITYLINTLSLQLYINGVFQPSTAYTQTSNSVITLSEGINTGDILTAVALFG